MAISFTEEEVMRLLVRDREIFSEKVGLVYRNACFHADQIAESTLLDGKDMDTAVDDACETFNQKLLQGLLSVLNNHSVPRKCLRYNPLDREWAKSK